MKTLNEQIQRLRDILHTCYESIASKGGTLPPVGERNMTNLPDAVESVPQVVGAELEELTITENGEYTPQEGVDGFSKVTARVVPTKRVVIPNMKVTNAIIIDGYWAGELVDTSVVTAMQAMFHSCSQLQSLDVSGWDTSKVALFDAMFQGCSQLQSLDVSGWDTSKVTAMQNMFNGCSQLQSLDVSGWDTSSVTAMYAMFQGCSQLQSLDVSGWDTSKVTAMQNMFNGCSQLQSLDVSGWDTSSVTAMYDMFQGCSQLQSLDASGWEIDNVTRIYRMFNRCDSLITLNLMGWNFKNAGDISSIFESCKNLQWIDLTNSNASGVTYANRVFAYCTQLQSLVGNRTIDDVVSNNISILNGIIVGYTNPFAGTSNIDRASLRAIINGLADLTGQTAQTLTLGATLMAKLTEEDIAIATNKNWTIA